MTRPARSRSRNTGGRDGLATRGRCICGTARVAVVDLCQRRRLRCFVLQTAGRSADSLTKWPRRRWRRWSLKSGQLTRHTHAAYLSRGASPLELNPLPSSMKVISPCISPAISGNKSPRTTKAHAKNERASCSAGMPIHARVDFAQLLRDLAALGMSPVAVADELTRMLGEHVARSTPYRWLDGSTPLHPHGAALLILHALKVGIRHGETADAHPPARRDPSTVEGDCDAGTPERPKRAA